MNHRYTEEEGYHYDLHHRHIGQGEHDVLREHVDNLVHNGEVWYLNFRCAAASVHMDEGQIAFRECGDDQSECDGNNGGKHEIEQSPQSQSANLRHVVHRQNTCHDGKQHQRHDDELQQIQEDASQRLDVIVHKVGIVLQQDAGNDSQDKCYSNLGGQRQFLHHTYFVFVCKDTHLFLKTA